MSKGSALSRAIRFFREADIDEVEVAFILVEKTVKRRVAERDAQDRATRAPRKTRRTKAQIAADNTISPAAHTALTASTKAIKESQEASAQA